VAEKFSPEMLLKMSHFPQCRASTTGPARPTANQLDDVLFPLAGGRGAMINVGKIVAWIVKAMDPMKRTIFACDRIFELRRKAGQGVRKAA
jgi:hypothetical protein